MATRRLAGARVWYIPDGYMPATATPETGLNSHEAVCVLNPHAQEAHIKLTVYFEHDDPWRDIAVTVGAERSAHIRLDRPQALGGRRIPAEIPYSLKVESDIPIIVQHSRMDVSQPRMALFTTIAYPSD